MGNPEFQLLETAKKQTLAPEALSPADENKYNRSLESLSEKEKEEIAKPYDKRGNERLTKFTEEIHDTLEKTRSVVEEKTGVVEALGKPNSYDSKKISGEVTLGVSKVPISPTTPGTIVETVNSSNGVAKALAENSTTLKQFQNGMIKACEGKPKPQQIAVLSGFAGLLGNQTYNYDMLNKSQQGDVTDDQQFSALRQSLSTGKPVEAGVCRHIHSWVAELARSMGFENSYALSTSSEKVRHEITLIDLKDGKVAAIDYEKAYVFDKKDIYRFKQQYLKSTGDLDLTERIYNPTTGKIVGYISTPLEDMLRNEVAGMQGVDKLISSRTTWQDGLNVSADISAGGGGKAQIGIGGAKSRLYIEGGRLQERPYGDGGAKYIAVGAETNQRVFGGDLNINGRVTKGSVDFINGKRLNEATLQLAASYTKGVNKNLGWTVFGEGVGLAKQSKETGRFQLQDGVAYLGAGINTSADFGNNKFQGSVGVTNHLDLDGRAAKGVSNLGVYGKGSVQFGENTEVHAGLTSNLEGKKLSAGASHTEGKVSVSIDAEKTKFNDSIQQNALKLTLGLDYNISKQVRARFEAKRDTKYSPGMQYGAQVGIRF